MRILYFADLADHVECMAEDLPHSGDPPINSVAGLLKFLRDRGEPWRSAMAEAAVTVAVNRQLATLNTRLNADDEVTIVSRDG